MNSFDLIGIGNQSAVRSKQCFILDIMFLQMYFGINTAKTFVFMNKI